MIIFSPQQLLFHREIHFHSEDSDDFVCIHFVYHDEENGDDKYLWVNQDGSKAAFEDSCDSAPGSGDLHDLNGKQLVCPYYFPKLALNSCSLCA